MYSTDTKHCGNADVIVSVKAHLSKLCSVFKQFYNLGIGKQTAANSFFGGSDAGC